GLRTGVVRAHLEAVLRIGERVHVVRVVVGLEGHDRGDRTSAGVGPEVADRLAGHPHVQRLVEELVDPAAGGHDNGVRIDLVEENARVLADVQILRKSPERHVGARDSGFRLDYDERPLRHVDRVAALGLLPVEPFPRDPARFESLSGALLERANDLDEAVQLEHRLAGFGFELPPEAERLLREPHVLGLRVGEPEDPRAPVARAPIVADPELLVDRHLMAAALQRPARGKTHHPSADHRDSHAIRFLRMPIPSTSSSTSSPGRSQRSSPCSRMQPVPTVPEPITSPGRNSVFRAAWARIASHDQYMSPRFPRERSSPFTRATISSRRSPSSSGLTTTGPSEVAKSLPFAGPSPIAISCRWRSRPAQSFITVKPPLAPSAPITIPPSSS